MENDKIYQHLSNFFPEDGYDLADIEEGVESGKIIFDESVIANMLKGSLLDESIVEVQLHDVDRVFFCRILDSPPNFEDDDNPDAGFDLVELEYDKASYLDRHDSLVTTPLEPSIGNYLISVLPQDNLRVVLRIFTAKSAIEFGCYFDSKVRVSEMPVLKAYYPIIARRVSGAREFRAKIPQNMNFEVRVGRKGSKKNFSTTPLDIGASGMALIDPMGKRTTLEADEIVHLELQAPGQPVVLVDASIKHVTKLRNSSGIQYCFGLQFDLQTRIVTSAVEKLVGLVQRKHLRELSDLAEEYGVDYDSW